MTHQIFRNFLIRNPYYKNLVKLSSQQKININYLHNNTSTRNKLDYVFVREIDSFSITERIPRNNMSSSSATPKEKPKVVFVLGGPGAGKGTQCQKIVKKFGFIHLSAGDLLREERAREGSEYGQLIESYIKDGKIVPVEITCSLLENAMNKNIEESGCNKFLIDGFPRNQNNLDGWQSKMSDKVNLLFVLFFDCPEQTCIERCLNRGQSGSGRTDDNLDSLKKRIQTYTNDSLPIIEYYKKLNLVRHIDASPNSDEVFAKVEAAFNEITSGDVGA